MFWAKFVGSGAAVCSEWCIEDVKSDTMQCMVHMRQLRQYSDSAQDYKWWCREVHQTIIIMVCGALEGKQSAVHEKQVCCAAVGDDADVW